MLHLYLWSTFFTVPSQNTNCNSYLGTTNFEIVTDRLGNTDIQTFHQQIKVGGTMSLSLQENVLTGQGDGTVSITGHEDRVPMSWSGSGTFSDQLTGQLIMDESCNAILRVNFDETMYINTVLTYSTGQTVVMPVQNVNYILEFKIEDGYTVEGPMLGAGQNGYAKWTLYLR